MIFFKTLILLKKKQNTKNVPSGEGKRMIRAAVYVEFFPGELVQR